MICHGSGKRQLHSNRRGEHLISCTPRTEDARCLTKRLLPRWNGGSGGLAARALPACCSPAGLAMLRRSYDGVTMGLRWGYDGVTMGLRWGYDGNQGKLGGGYGLWMLSATRRTSSKPGHRSGLRYRSGLQQPGLPDGALQKAPLLACMRGLFVRCLSHEPDCEAIRGAARPLL
jgi:hypothetical protein